MMIATGTPEFPKRVACLGTQAITSDRDVPDNTQIIAEFPGGYSLLVVGSTVNERGLPDILRTHKAVIEFGGDRIEVKPERPFAEEMDPIVRQGLRPQGVDFVAEYRDLFTAIRENGETRGGIELCVRAQVLISLAEASQRLGAICHFDEKARKVTDASGKEIAIPSYEHPMLKA
jgi:hypothetical protein